MTTRIIDKHVTPYEPYCVWGEAFTLEDCERIKQLGDLFEFHKGRIGNNAENSSVRNTDITWIQPRDDTYWIFDRFSQLAAKINFDKYQMDLKHFDGFQYSKYKVESHYDWHVDVSPDSVNGLFRKLSFSLMLSDPQDYEGGELCLNTTGRQDNAVCFKPKKGELVVFYSYLPHKVAPVTSGERIALVTWAIGEKIR